MEKTTAAQPNMLNVLLVDDYEPSRKVQTYVIEHGHKDVKVTSVDRPPDFAQMMTYDGIILDQKLIGETGLEIATRISEANWRIPIMIMTSLQSSDETFKTAYQHVDYIAWKSDPAMFGKILESFVRQIRRIRDANQPASTLQPVHDAAQKEAPVVLHHHH